MKISFTNCYRIKSYSKNIFFFLTLFLSISNICFASNNGGDIDGIVKSGSIGNQIAISITNPSVESPIDSVNLKIEEAGNWITNIRINSDEIGSIAPKSTRRFIILFDISPDAENNEIDRVTLRVNAKGALVDNPLQVIAVKIEEEKISKKPSKYIYVLTAIKAGQGKKYTSTSEIKWIEHKNNEKGYLERGSGNPKYNAYERYKMIRCLDCPDRIILGEPINFRFQARSRFDTLKYSCGDVPVGFSNLFISCVFDGFSDPAANSNDFSVTAKGDGFQSVSCEELGLKIRPDPVKKKLTGAPILTYPLVPLTLELSNTLDISLIPIGKSETSDKYLTFKYSVKYHSIKDQVFHMWGLGNEEQPSNKVEVAVYKELLNTPDEYNESDKTMTIYINAMQFIYTLQIDNEPSELAWDILQVPAAFTKKPLNNSPLVNKKKEEPKKSDKIDKNGSENKPDSPTDEEEKKSELDPNKPNSINPDHPKVATLIKEWISSAEPPMNATDGANARYEAYGRWVGEGIDGIIGKVTANPDDVAGRTPEKYVWDKRNKLDSVDHCTLGEYVIDKLKNSSIGHCKGRYKLNKDKQRNKQAEELIKKSRELWEQGKLDEAIKTAKKASQTVPKNVKVAKTHEAMKSQKIELDKRLKKVSEKIRNNKLKEAERILDGAARISEKYPEYKKARQALSDAKKKAREDEKRNKLAEELKKKAKDLWRRGELAKAIVTIKKASQTVPNNAKIAKIHGSMKSQKKIMDNALSESDGLIGREEFKKAKSTLARAGRISSNYPPYVGMLDKLRNAKEKSDRIKKQKKKAEELLKKAKDLWKRGHLGEAVKTAKKASEIAPKNSKISKIHQAMKSQKKIMDKSLSKSDDLIGREEFKKAKSTLARAGRISSNYPPYVGMLDKLRKAKEKFDRIKKIIEEAKQQWSRQKSQSAIGKLDKALTIDPHHREAGSLKKEWEKILRDQEKARKPNWDNGCYNGKNTGGAMLQWTLRDPPPYSGLTPICSDRDGKLWILNNKISQIIKGKQNSYGCYSGSTVKAKNRDYRGTLCRSKGYNEKTVIPNVVGMSKKQAEHVFKKRGVKTKVIFGNPASSPRESKTIEKTIPSAGNSVNRGEIVTIVIHPPFVDRRTVPKLSGATKQEIIKKIKDAGLVPRIKTVRASSVSQSGEVSSVNPSSGTEVMAGATVFVDVFDTFDSGSESDPWVDKVVSFTRPPGSSDQGYEADIALGKPTSAKFVAIDKPETIIFAFTDNVVVDGEGNDLKLHEYVNGDSPVKVFASTDNIRYVFLGKTANSTEYDLANYELSIIRYVKLVGLADGGQAKGYDLMAIEALNSSPDNATTFVDNVEDFGGSKRTVPNLEGLTEEEIISKIKSAGLVPKIKRVKASSSEQSGKVSTIKPLPGTEVISGSIIYVDVFESFDGIKWSGINGDWSHSKGKIEVTFRNESNGFYKKIGHLKNYYFKVGELGFKVRKNGDYIYHMDIKYRYNNKHSKPYWVKSHLKIIDNNTMVDGNGAEWKRMISLGTNSNPNNTTIFVDDVEDFGGTKCENYNKCLAEMMQEIQQLGLKMASGQSLTFGCKYLGLGQAMVKVSKDANSAGCKIAGNYEQAGDMIKETAGQICKGQAIDFDISKLPACSQINNRTSVINPEVSAIAKKVKEEAEAKAAVKRDNAQKQPSGKLSDIYNKALKLRPTCNPLADGFILMYLKDPRFFDDPRIAKGIVEMSKKLKHPSFSNDANLKKRISEFEQASEYYQSFVKAENLYEKGLVGFDGKPDAVTPAIKEIIKSLEEFSRKYKINCDETIGEIPKATKKVKKLRDTLNELKSVNIRCEKGELKQTAKKYDAIYNKNGGYKKEEFVHNYLFFGNRVSEHKFIRKRMDSITQQLYMWNSIEIAENYLKKAIAQGGNSSYYYDVNLETRLVIGNGKKSGCKNLVKRAKEMRQLVPRGMKP